ncbi:MAG: OadG family transporter subunit [Clostridia bacterium]
MTSLLLFEEISLGNIALLSLVGMALIIAVLALLMYAIKLMALLLKDRKPATDSATQTNQSATQTNLDVVNAQPTLTTTTEQTPGGIGVGSVKLYDCEEQDAALIMAIVADTSEIPVQELQFVSIKRVKGE